MIPTILVAVLYFALGFFVGGWFGMRHYRKMLERDRVTFNGEDVSALVKPYRP